MDYDNIEIWPTVQLLFAGNCTFTIKSKKTGQKYTFRITKPRHKLPVGGIYNVSTRDHDSSWKYMFSYFLRKYIDQKDGKQKDMLVAELTPASTIRCVETHPAAAALNWFVGKLEHTKPVVNMELYYANTCCRCGRQLTDDRSIRRHVGPECVKYIGTEK